MYYIKKIIFFSLFYNIFNMTHERCILAVATQHYPGDFSEDLLEFHSKQNVTN